MVKCFKEVEVRRPCREDLESRLKRHPHLRARIEGLLDIVDNAGDDLEKASAAEQRVMGELRKMGNEALHCWAENQERKKAEELEKSNTEATKKVKKTSLAHVLRNNRDF